MATIFNLMERDQVYSRKTDPVTPLRQRMIEGKQLRNPAAETQRNYIAHGAISWAQFKVLAAIERVL